jgi:hyperosmotically inducible periplasmic protein
MRRLLLLCAACCALTLPSFAQPGEESPASSAVGTSTHPVQTKKSDRTLARNVRRALGHVQGLDAQGIRVIAQHGAVTLSGTVRTTDAMSEAERAARSVDGVRSVTNRLTLYRGENG